MYRLHPGCSLAQHGWLPAKESASMSPLGHPMSKSPFSLPSTSVSRCFRFSIFTHQFLGHYPINMR